MITTIPHISDIFLCLLTTASIQMQSAHISGSHGSNASSGEPEIPSGPTMHPPATAFKITAQDTNILDMYIDEFEQADTQMRSKILEKVMGALYRLRPGNSMFDKKEAKQACIVIMHMCIGFLTESYFQKIQKWFYNHYSAPHLRTTKFIRRWSARNVFYHNKRADIMELAQELSGCAPGSQEFLGSLQPATTHLWNELSTEEQESYAETARDWSENAPPNHIQSRQVIHHFPCTIPLIQPPRMATAAIRGRIIRDFQTQLYKTCGVRTIVLLAYAKEDGTPQVAMYVILLEH